MRQKSSKSLPFVSVTSLVRLRRSLGGNFRFDFQAGMEAPPSSEDTCLRGPLTLLRDMFELRVIALIVMLNRQVFESVVARNNRFKIDNTLVCVF